MDPFFTINLDEYELFLIQKNHVFIRYKESLQSALSNSHAGPTETLELKSNQAGRILNIRLTYNTVTIDHVKTALK